MKRLICALLMVLFIMDVPANAVIIENTDTVFLPSRINTEHLNNDPKAQAQMMKRLGLFNGTNKGFELEKDLTRCEAAAMLVRFMGAEDKVLAGSWTHPFTDVPEWADKYVGWLYQSGLTKGVGKNKYGSDQPVTYTQYATFLSRACAGNDDFLANGIGRKEEMDLSDINNLFLRADAIALSARALSCYYTRNGSDMTMAEFLVQKKVFTPEQLGEAAWGVLPSEYGYHEVDNDTFLHRIIAGVPVARCPEKDLYISQDSVKSPLPYFYASRVTRDSRVDVYTIDCKTMEIQLSGGYNSTTCKGLDYIGSVDGRDYLLEETLLDDGTLHRGALLCRDGENLKEVLSARELWGNVVPYANDAVVKKSDDSLALVGTEYIYVLTPEDTFRYEIAAGTKILCFDGKKIITELADHQETTISCIDISSGAVVDEYTVPQDLEGELRTIKVIQGSWLYGQAGLYAIDHSTGRLRQVTDRPVADVTAYQNDGRPIILTHEPGKRVWGMNSFGGDQIILIEDDGTERILLGNHPEHGLRIAGFTFAEGSSIGFYTAEDQGMQHFNIFNYVLAADGSIDVQDYTAGRPETEDGFYNDTDAYKQKYIESEQKRLNSLGYGKRH